MKFEKNLLLGKNKISYRNNIYPCNCCHCKNSDCQCSCDCKCHIHILNLQNEQNMNNINITMKNNSVEEIPKNKNRNKKIMHYKSTSNIINDEINYFKNLKNPNNKENENINNLDENINEIISNNNNLYNNDNYKNSDNYSKPNYQTDRNHLNQKRSNIIDYNPNSTNYLLYFMTKGNYQMKKDKNKKANKAMNIKNKKDNNLINSYLSEGKYINSYNELNNNKNDNNENVKKKNNKKDISDIFRIYENKKIKGNKNWLDLKISKFDIFIKENGLNNIEDEKLIKIYEKKIQQLEQRLSEENKKVNQLNTIIINDKKKIFNLKKELEEKNKNSNTKSKFNYNNIISRNNNSLIIKLPKSFQRFKVGKEESQIDDNSFDRALSNNQNNNFKLYYNNYINKYAVYRKKISSRIYMKINRALSQPNMNKSKLNEKFYEKLDNIKRPLVRQKLLNNKIIYIIYPLSNSQKLLSFDMNTRKYSFKNINKSKNDNFSRNYSESFNPEDSQFNSIFLFYNNMLYIITGKNSDIFYQYDPIKNEFKQLCKLKNNHANGVLLVYENKIFCLSGKYNKKVEIYLKEKNEWIEFNEMNIERSCFSACIIQNKFIFSLFGYSTPSNKYLDTIEFCDISDYNNYSYMNKCTWKYLLYKNENKLNLNICGFVSMNYKNEKIIIFGGINGIQRKSVDKFYQIILGQNFEFEDNESYTYVEEIKKQTNDIYKNNCYYFSNGIGIFKNEIPQEKNEIMYGLFDSNYNAHIMKIKDKLIHDVYYFKK